MSNSVYNFNPGKKSWKIYANELTSISGDDLIIIPNENKDIILEVSGNGNILFKEDGITYNLANLSNAASSSVNLTNYHDASFGNVDITGGIIITVNDVNSQNITLLELKTNTNTPLIKHDFWQNSSGYADYQIYPASASTTDFKIGGYNSTFETIRLNALNGIEIYSNQSTNSYGNIKGNDASLNNVDIGGNLNIKSGLAIDNIFGVSGQVLTSQGYLSAPRWSVPSNVNLTNHDDASFINVDISGSLRIKGGDFNFNYVVGATPNYINSFNYLANTPLIDANSDNIFTTNNTNLDIAYSPTLNIFVNLRRDSVLYSYDGISWYFCKKSDNSNFSFNGKYSGTIEWFSGNVNRFYVSLTHAGFSSTDSIYYSSNGINWTNITVNGGAYQFMPHKLAYSPTLNKIIATGSGNGGEGLWVADATGSNLDFTNIATNNEYISPWEADGGMFPVIWDSNLEKFILTTEGTGGGKQIYYNSDNNLTSWTLLTNIYDFNNNLTTDGTLNKTCYSIAFSPTLDRSVFVGQDAIYYSDFVGGTAISNLVFKQTKDINGSNYSDSPTYRKIIWDSVSEYFIVAANAGSHDVIYSANGINWFSNNQETSSPSGYLARGHGALAYGNGKLLLIGYHNNNVYQTDSNYIATSIADIYNFGNNNLDASFDNVEISGKIKLPDSSNNGYGISGESLISQGPNNPPIWNPNYKVYGFYYMSNEFGSTFTASTWTSIKNSNDTYATLGTFTPSDLFTVINVNNLIRIPRTGTYKIDLTVNVFANNFTTDMYVILTSQVAGTGDFTELQVVSFVDNYGQAGDKFYIKTFHINYLGTFNRDDEIGCDAYVGGSSGRINGDKPSDSLQVKRTSICIHNVD